MAANSFGEYFRITTFGESHGVGLGVVIDGCPAGVPFDRDLLHRWMARRRPGSSAAVSARHESDTPEILSGVYENKTLGTPITLVVRNEDAHPADYAGVSPRLGHADDVWRDKFTHVDPRGGGRSSGRETVARVMAGAVAEMFLRAATPEMRVHGLAKSVGELPVGVEEQMGSAGWGRIAKFLEGLKSEGESVGGVGEVRVAGAPRGLGAPVFHKLKSDLSMAIMSIGAVVGFELGDGFALAARKGTETHALGNEKVYGGIRGGISTGEDICFRFAVKPTSSILDVAKKGRHDPCILLRALPVAEAMTWLVLADHALGQRLVPLSP